MINKIDIEKKLFTKHEWENTKEKLKEKKINNKIIWNNKNERRKVKEISKFEMKSK